MGHQPESALSGSQHIPVYDDIIQILFGYIYNLQNSQVVKTLQSKVT
jgi:hypothetical protein